MAMKGITVSKDAHLEGGRNSNKCEKKFTFSEIQGFENALGKDKKGRKTQSILSRKNITINVSEILGQYLNTGDNTGDKTDLGAKYIKCWKI